MALSPPFHEVCETETRRLTIRGRGFRFFVPKTLDGFVDRADIFQDFPLWAKIWEASIVLADHLAGTPVEPDRRFLEIGAGLGVVSIVAAAFGHRMTMTEFNPDALRFASANARLNLNSPAPCLQIQELDWTRPRIEGPFDCIVGSEVVYRESDFELICRLIQACLKPKGECIFTEGIRQTSIRFFQRMGRDFQMKAVRKALRSKELTIPVILCRMRFRGH